MVHLSSRRKFLQTLTIASGAFVAGSLLTEKAHARDDDDELMEEIFILPYLQNPAPNGMTVCFLSTAASGVKVEYGPAKGSGMKAVNTSKQEIPGTTWTVFKARLKDLKPGESYKYCVSYKIGKEAKKTETYTFTTLNWAAQGTKGIAFNDVHNKSEVIEALMAHVKPEDFDYSLLLGDMWNDPHSGSNALTVFMTMEAYVRLLDASSKPMFYIRGNHDTRGNFADRISYLFDLPNNDPKDKFEDQNAYYDFRCGPVWYIAPDAGEDAEKRAEIFQPYRQRQVSWMKKIFSKSPARNAPWRIIPIHIPMYTPGGWDQPDALKRWEPVLDKERIDVMIAGHDHAHHVVPKGKTFERKSDKVPQTPPYPVLVGGGPSKGGGEIGTVMFIKANQKNLQIRMIDTNGKELHKLDLTK